MSVDSSATGAVRAGRPGLRVERRSRRAPRCWNRFDSTQRRRSGKFDPAETLVGAGSPTVAGVI
jgi:hypothetical protein